MNLDLTTDQAEFLKLVMRYWQTSGVNYWSAQSAKEIADLLEK